MRQRRESLPTQAPPDGRARHCNRSGKDPRDREHGEKHVAQREDAFALHAPTKPGEFDRPNDAGRPELEKLPQECPGKGASEPTEGAQPFPQEEKRPWARQLEVTVDHPGDLPGVVENLIEYVTADETANEHPANERAQLLNVDAESACSPLGKGHARNDTQCDQNSEGVQSDGPRLNIGNMDVRNHECVVNQPSGASEYFRATASITRVLPRSRGTRRGRFVPMFVGVVCLLSAAGANARGVDSDPPPPRHLFVLDVRGDGFDLSGTNRAAGTRWTTAKTDDAFLAVDATGLRAIGIDTLSRGGVRLEGIVLVSSGLRLKVDSRATEIVDAWQMLAFLDGNRDGRVDSKDLCWSHLRIFTDSNGDGVIAQTEVRSTTDADVREIVGKVAGPREGRTDAQGNVLVDGQFTRSDGMTGKAADVTFARVPDRQNSVAAR